MLDPDRPPSPVPWTTWTPTDEWPSFDMNCGSWLVESWDGPGEHLTLLMLETLNYGLGPDMFHRLTFSGVQGILVRGHGGGFAMTCVGWEAIPPALRGLWPEPSDVGEQVYMIAPDHNLPTEHVIEAATVTCERRLRGWRWEITAYDPAARSTTVRVSGEPFLGSGDCGEWSVEDVEQTDARAGMSGDGKLRVHEPDPSGRVSVQLGDEPTLTMLARRVMRCC